MARLHLLGAVAFLFLQIARCDNPLVSRDHPLVPGEVEPVADIEYSPQVGSMPLSGRELVSEWTNTGSISKRSSIADDVGMIPDAAQPYHSAVPAPLTAWPNRTASVAALQAPVPAATPATPSAAASRSGGPAARTGATVSKATSAAQMAARQTGDSAALTDRSAILGISASSIRGLGDTAATTEAPQTTEAPRVTSTPVYDVEYRYYYWTFTWSYYSYYYTYVYAVQESTLTTTYVTTTTTISAYQSNSADATSELSSISSKYFSTGFPTPTEATTALAAATSGNSPSETGSSGDSGDNGGSVPGVGVGIVGVGGPGSVGGAGMVQSSLPALTLWVFAMGAVAAGTGMLLL
ncbi:hypothetical protein V502_07437 [Pseudogymnoascus sp. VKM F-4520 (FW-2644)]|nr:hypothetical protein V502_07437 [Pseudogymnoascus sp. VKM F-4520 (FW-2644)]